MFQLGFLLFPFQVRNRSADTAVTPRAFYGTLEQRTMKRFHWNLAAVVGCMIATLSSTPDVVAQSSSTVTIKAYDNKGKDTGKCLRGPDAASEGPGGYRLVSCDRKAKNQQFRFNPNVGSTIVQAFGENPVTDGIAVFLVVPRGADDRSWFSGAPVAHLPSGSTNYGSASKEWRWVGRQIANADEKSGKYCLTTTQGNDVVRIDKCSNTATLTQWDVLVVN